MKKTYFSHRIYKHTLPETSVQTIEQTLSIYNQSKHFAFQTLIREKRGIPTHREESLHLTVKKRYGLNDYFANSAVQEAQALLSSIKERQKLDLQITEEQIRAVKKKIKITKHHLTTLYKIKASFVKGKPTFPAQAREQQRGNYFVVQYKQQTALYPSAYLFEHTYLDVQIQEKKNQLGQLQFRLHRLEQKRNSLKNKVKSAVFGTKKLFRAQHTKEEYVNDHDLWLEEWRKARSHSMTISGRKDAKEGNFVFSYLLDTRSLFFTTSSGVIVEIPQVTFPYGEKIVDAEIMRQRKEKDKKKNGKPIAWSIEDHGEYYLIKCIVEVDKNPHTNYSKADGVIGVDCNYDHFAWAEINAKGQCIQSGRLFFDIEGKSSGQITKIIEAEAIKLVDLAHQRNKPIVVEKLDTTTSKVSTPYGNKQANRKKSQFAYRKMIQAIRNRAEKMGVGVYEVNPAFSSQMGKIKYIRRLGISIHQAAAYVIARRAMGFKEKLPPVLYSLLPEQKVGLHHWAHWKWVSNVFSGVRTHAFYQMKLFHSDRFSRIHDASELFLLGALTDWERKGLLKWKSRKSLA